MIEGQMSIFDFIPEAKPSTEMSISAIEDEVILLGSGFSNGKKRIFEFFQSNTKSKDRIAFLKNEYGVGGSTIKYGWQQHDANGIDIKFKELIGKVSEVHIGWMMVERRIQDLIDSGKYYQRDICSHSEHECNKEELWKIADTFDDIKCPRICCRVCDEFLCGARCNGALGRENEEFWKNWHKEHDKVEVDIKGICDDGYCPKCNMSLDDLVERCPECGVLLDWTHWKILNSN